MIFRAADIATAWRAVGVATAKDRGAQPGRRGILIEEFNDGARLVATDGCLLLMAWVPFEAGDLLAPEPSVEDAPSRSMVIDDSDGRGGGVLLHAAKLADKGASVVVDVRIALSETPEALSFAGMERRSAIIDVVGIERVVLESIEGPFPDWRRLYSDWTSEAIDTIALGASALAKLAKVAKVAGSGIAWEWGGEHRAARIAAVDSDLVFAGLVAPLRLGVGS